ncbi:MAG: MFS transporter [Desulfovibrio sp.]|nr:MFS transporter [Desulfovibrio sp.]
MNESRGLIALALGTFSLGIAEFAMMAIISPLAAALGLTIPEAGDFISAYAIGVSIGSPMPLLFRKFALKHLLLGLSCLIIFGNLAAAISPGYWSLLCARFIAGLPHGAYFGVAAIVAVSLVAPGRRASAVAIMISGMTLANLAGVPLCTWFANTFSWRLTFVTAAVAALATFLSIRAFIPLANPKQQKSIKREFSFLRGLAPWLIFAATFLGQGSIYCWYSYMEPILLNVSQISPHSMKWVMLISGLGMFLGGIGAGRLSDHFPPALVSGCIAVLIAPILLLIHNLSGNAPLAITLVFFGAAALFGLGGPLQYLIVRYSRGGEILGGAGIQIAFNVSNAAAAAIGGAVINAGYGFTAPALVGIPLALASAAILIWFYCRYRKNPA